MDIYACFFVYCFPLIKLKYLKIYLSLPWRWCFLSCWMVLVFMSVKPFEYEIFSGEVVDTRIEDGCENQAGFMPLYQEEKEEPEEITYSAEDVAVARKAGYEEGHKEAMAAIDREKQQQNQQLEVLLGNIGGKLEQFFAGNSVQLQAISNDTVILAVEVARKVADKALQENPQANIEEMVGRCMGLIASEPKIVVTVNEALVSPLQERFSAIAQEKGFTGKVELQGDNAIAVHDCRLEWQNGGAEIDTAQKWQRIREALGVKDDPN